MYKQGLGVEKNITMTVMAYALSGELGHGDSWFSLGFMYEKGNDVDQNYLLAIEYYTKGALLNNQSCQINLGALYDDGRGTPVNKQEALKWFKKASELGDIDATYNVGLMYLYGEGVEKDIVQAQKHLCNANEYLHGINGNVPFESVQILRKSSKKISTCVNPYPFKTCSSEERNRRIEEHNEELYKISEKAFNSITEFY